MSKRTLLGNLLLLRSYGATQLRDRSGRSLQTLILIMLLAGSATTTQAGCFLFGPCLDVAGPDMGPCLSPPYEGDMTIEMDMDRPDSRMNACLSIIRDLGPCLSIAPDLGNDMPADMPGDMPGDAGDMPADSGADGGDAGPEMGALDPARQQLLQRLGDRLPADVLARLQDKDRPA